MTSSIKARIARLERAGRGDHLSALMSEVLISAHASTLLRREDLRLVALVQAIKAGRPLRPAEAEDYRTKITRARADVAESCEYLGLAEDATAEDVIARALELGRQEGMDAKALGKMRQSL